MTATVKVFGVVLALFACATFAQSGDERDAEAKRRFELATRFYAQGNKEQALDELERVLALSERPAVLINLVIVHAELGHPEAAVTYADRLLGMNTTLDAKRLERVKTIRATQRAKLGEVRISVPVEGVDVSLAGKPLGASPLPAPVLASAGKVVLSAKAPRYEPVYREVLVQPGAALEVVLELKPTPVNLGSVRVRCPVPGVDLFVDGVRVGGTPAVTKVAVMPGARVVSARRDGYRSAEQTVTVPEGGEVEVELLPRAEEADGSAARVSVTTSEDQVTAVVDGQRKGLLGAALELAPGPHLLVFERGGFYPVRRTVSLTANAAESLSITFEPTPERRGELASQRFWHQLLGTIGVGAAVAGATASAIYTFGYLGNERRVALADLAALNAQADAKMGCYLDRNGCILPIEEAQRRVAQVDSLRTIGVVGFIASAALLGGGLAALFTAPNLSKYDRRPEGDDFVPELSFAAAPQGAMVAASGRF
jgi:hypothetical protein